MGCGVVSPIWMRLLLSLWRSDAVALWLCTLCTQPVPYAMYPIVERVELQLDSQQQLCVFTRCCHAVYATAICLCRSWPSVCVSLSCPMLIGVGVQRQRRLLAIVYIDRIDTKISDYLLLISLLIFFCHLTENYVLFCEIKKSRWKKSVAMNLLSRGECLDRLN